MAIKLPLLPPFQPLVDDDKTATSIFQQWWQQVVQAIEASIDAIQTALAAAIAAQQTADEAQDQAIQAALDAANAATAAANAQTTANGKLDQTAADARYVQKNVTPAWAGASGTASRAAYTTYTSPTISNPPTQAEVQAISDAVQSISQHMKALIDDLTANGTLT
jgi:hypothetical protein